ncbi:UDP-N-acetylmuramate--L-alanine ligase [Capnocytophaga canimorsus]|uniref:UDP-N-acetylmuramate--L-alanine ligase n=1 Tax=Capnocytophaga canimorsus TaxID=28188 RepID=UPI001EDD47E8|nr:Mur ligase family protein [Capnocytophaga canimorsus]GJQ05348.1 peptidoglycan synthetase [Capnocytophaga canimorsus]
MRIHFISIGGAAMHNLALELSQLGNVVSGSDDAIYEPSRSRLQQAGLLPQAMGWFPKKITSDLDIVILGMHAKKDNPELLEAQRLGLRICSYPEFIYEHSKNKTRVVIGGSHGKTTITSMVLHVMNYCGIAVDYLVGAQLEGFERMVRLSQTAEFMLIEGDEYLSSPIDLKSKFHWYKPNIALVSGIAWDHINVFPTPEVYAQQFKVFVDSIVNGGILVYNEEDTLLVKIVNETENPIRKLPYHTPHYQIRKGITYLITEEGELPLEIFGKHNMSNLEGAKQICQHMGVDENDFYQAILSFKGASKRLEKMYLSEKVAVFKDFAHAPSKVRATVASVVEQFPEKEVEAFLELHTFSSLRPEFLKEYAGSLDKATSAVVYYDEGALKTKGVAGISPEFIREMFQREDIKVFNKSADFQEYIYNKTYNNSVLLLMSSGNYGGLNFQNLIDKIIKKY